MKSSVVLRLCVFVPGEGRLYVLFTRAQLSSHRQPPSAADGGVECLSTCEYPTGRVCTPAGFVNAGRGVFETPGKRRFRPISRARGADKLPNLRADRALRARRASAFIVQFTELRSDPYDVVALVYSPCGVVAVLYWVLPGGMVGYV